MEKCNAYKACHANNFCLSLFPFDVSFFCGGWRWMVGVFFCFSHDCISYMCSELQSSKQKHAHFCEPHQIPSTNMNSIFILFACFSLIFIPFYLTNPNERDYFMLNRLEVLDGFILNSNFLCYKSIEHVFSLIFQTNSICLFIWFRSVWWWKYSIPHKRLQRTNSFPLQLFRLFNNPKEFVWTVSVSVRHMSTLSLNELNMFHLSLFSISA